MDVIKQNLSLEFGAEKEKLQAEITSLVQELGIQKV